ncbi:energy-coupled thiamine transporter ThiT [Sporanaerobium hydrogeniformans]|uniref:Energy-coupled thiamine transporter ThiT n=1 Tax=Sporanaerobium hydrogeniformans TaxID=3072179 RepID=A0AC61DDD0_9FIRM|nr:energy-coupled thiamine transporter ThiT [Sporanaerobium hydrogeniformans]PHV70577.1 energy-coupled thiamine transporter ThiT [Sporanaerobium hydrogeniformans]
MSHIFTKLLEISPLVWTILGVIVLFSLLGLVWTSKKEAKQSSTLTTKKVVYGGMCIALSFILSYIRLYKMPQGGSITLASMFPIILYSMVFGPIAGIVTGVAYGFLQLIQDAWVLNWAQLLFDYPLAFGFLGLAGMAPSAIKAKELRTVLAVSIALLGRGLMHFLSGIIFFADSAPEGTSAVLYSLGYNASYIIPELIITLILSVILISTPIYGAMKKSVA